MGASPNWRQWPWSQNKSWRASSGRPTRRRSFWRVWTRSPRIRVRAILWALVLAFLGWLANTALNPGAAMRRLLPLCIFLMALSWITGACREAASAARRRRRGRLWGPLMRCVDQATTLAENKACRARVNAEWQIVETVTKDGGQ